MNVNGGIRPRLSWGRSSYVSRPPVSIERRALTAQGQVRYRLKTPYRDGTTHIVLEPVGFMARLAALVPPPRAPPPGLLF